MHPLKRLTLTKDQNKYIASFLKTLAEGIVLGSSTAVFLPEAMQIKRSIPLERYLAIMITGLLCIIIGVILEKKGKK